MRDSSLRFAAFGMTAGSWGEARVDAQAKRRYVKDEKQIPRAAALVMTALGAKETEGFLRCKA
jgi:hypothetical protein